LRSGLVTPSGFGGRPRRLFQTIEHFSGTILLRLGAPQIIESADGLALQVQIVDISAQRQLPIVDYRREMVIASVLQ
jgi:hypothetical protein